MPFWQTLKREIIACNCDGFHVEAVVHVLYDVICDEVPALHAYLYICTYMCLYPHVCVYIYTYFCMCVCVCVMYVYLCVYIQYVHISRPWCTCSIMCSVMRSPHPMRTCTYDICVYLHMCMCIYTYVYVCMCVCNMYVYLHIYI